jgi:hypothetical protein
MELSKIVPGWQANKDATPQKIRFFLLRLELTKEENKKYKYAWWLHEFCPVGHSGVRSINVQENPS